MCCRWHGVVDCAVDGVGLKGVHYMDYKCKWHNMFAASSNKASSYTYTTLPEVAVGGAAGFAAAL